MATAVQSALTTAAVFATGRSSAGCKPCAQPLVIAAAKHTVEHHTFATGAASSTSKRRRIVARRPTFTSY